MGILAQFWDTFYLTPYLHTNAVYGLTVLPNFFVIVTYESGVYMGGVYVNII